MPRSPVILDKLPEENIQRRLAEAEEAQRNRVRVSSGAPGAPGAPGAEGKEGHGAGVLYRYITNTENSDPGSGKLKFGGPLGESTTMRISETDLDGNAGVGDWLKTWDDNGEKPHGYMFMRKRAAPGTFIILKFGRVITSITDNGTWLAMSEFEKVGGSATGFANNDEVYVEYFAAGQKGATGSTGSTGPAGEPGGFKFWWQGKAEKSSAKFFSLNNAAPASATKMYIGAEAIPGQNIKAWLETFDDRGESTNRGIVILRDLAESKYYAIFRITGTVTSEASGVSFAVEWITGSTELSNPLALHEHSLEFYGSGEKGATGSTGGTGPTGAAGQDAGIEWEFNSSTTIENPGTEKFRLNNATKSSVTQIALRENSAKGGLNPAAYVESWDDSTSTIKGYLILRKKESPTSFAIYQLNSMNDEGEWDKLNVTHIDSGGASWASGDKITWEFYRTGDKGTTGSEGPKGETGSTGAAGPPAGIKLKFLTNTEETDPGTGGVKFNKTTLSEVTRMYISEKEFAGNSIQSVLETLVSGTETIRSHLYFQQENDPTKWALFFCVSTRTDLGEYEKFEIGYVSGPGGFENTQPIRMQFTKTGDKGEKGATGSEGPAGFSGPRDIFQAEGVVPAAQGVGTYLMGNAGLVASGANSAGLIGGIHFVRPKDYTVSEKATKFKIKGFVAVNAGAAPGLTTFKFSLRKVTKTAGAAGGITYTLGEALLTTTVGEVLSKEQVKTLETTTAKELEEGVYALVLELGAFATAASSFEGVSARLQVVNE